MCRNVSHDKSHTDWWDMRHWNIQNLEYLATYLSQKQWGHIQDLTFTTYFTYNVGYYCCCYFSYKAHIVTDWDDDLLFQIVTYGLSKCCTCSSLQRCPIFPAHAHLIPCHYSAFWRCHFGHICTGMLAVTYEESHWPFFYISHVRQQKAYT